MTDYIRINKRLYEELQDWTESQAFKDTYEHFVKPIYKENMTLESHPPQYVTYYYADPDLFWVWYPVRTENDPYRKEN